MGGSGWGGGGMEGLGRGGERRNEQARVLEVGTD